MRQSFGLEMSLGESYIEGIAICYYKEYKINIQGGATCLILPSEFGGADHAVINFGTNSGNNQKLETKVEYNND